MTLIEPHESERGVFWIGAYNGGLNRYDRTTGTVTHYEFDPNDPFGLSANTVWTHDEDRQGTHWIGTWISLHKVVPVPRFFRHHTLDPNDPTTWGKIGRNEHCPCGSDKKYKHCHGKI